MTPTSPSKKDVHSTRLYPTLLLILLETQWERYMFHFMDGPHQMITRSGDLLFFSKWDEKKQKMFISKSPKPPSKTHNSHTIQEDWYYKFHGHAKQYGIYIHNYFDFLKLSNDWKGFKCSDDSDSTLYDVPCLLESQQREWDLTIHAALQDIFSTPAGTNEYKIIQNRHGHGYEVLFNIICPDHPEHDTYPSLLI